MQRTRSGIGPRPDSRTGGEQEFHGRRGLFRCREMQRGRTPSTLHMAFKTVGKAMPNPCQGSQPPEVGMPPVGAIPFGFLALRRARHAATRGTARSVQPSVRRPVLHNPLPQWPKAPAKPARWRRIRKSFLLIGPSREHRMLEMAGNTDPSEARQAAICGYTETDLDTVFALECRDDRAWVAFLQRQMQRAPGSSELAAPRPGGSCPPVPQQDARTRATEAQSITLATRKPTSSLRIPEETPRRTAPRTPLGE